MQPTLRISRKAMLASNQRDLHYKEEQGFLSKILGAWCSQGSRDHCSPSLRQSKSGNDQKVKQSKKNGNLRV